MQITSGMLVKLTLLYQHAWVVILKLFVYVIKSHMSAKHGIFTIDMLSGIMQP